MPAAANGLSVENQLGNGLSLLIFVGGKYLWLLFSGNLGTRVSGEVWNENLQIYEKITGDNSFLILLYGVVTLAVTAIFLCVWVANVKGSLENDFILSSK